MAQQKESIANVERRGYRIIDGGQEDAYGDDGKCDYRCTDWRTGQVLFAGRGTYTDYCAAMDAAEKRDGRIWCHRDHVDEVATEGTRDDLTPPEVAHIAGLPEALLDHLTDWVEEAATPLELAGLTGLPEAHVQEVLREWRGK